MKKKALILAICMAASAPAISVAKGLPSEIVGLNLGDINSSSFLGQPFNGTIPILFSSIEEAKKLQISLAPNHIFKEIGAEKLPYLNSLKFEVGIKKNKPVIFVSSSQATDTPFISFVLKMVSSQGIVYQDYTVLIDPPGYQQDNLKSSELSQAVVSTTIDTTSVQKITESTGLEYKVNTGDTLSGISQALKTSQVSLKKMIDVIHEMNPKAFVQNDINKLKRGIYLRIPSANKIQNFKFETSDKTVLKEEIHQEEQLATNRETSESYIVKSGDSLSTITQKFGDDEVSFTKRLHAIYEANPHAFSNNRINNLKVGSTLSIPYLKSIVIEQTSEKEVVEANVKEFTKEKADLKSEKSFEKSSDPIIKEFANVDNDPIVKEHVENSVKEDAIRVEATESIVSTEEVSEAKTITTNEEKNEKPIIDIASASEKSFPEEYIENNETTVEKAEVVKTVSSTNALANTNLITNLEKRVRELRNNLSESRSKLSYLEDILVTRNIEIKKKSRKIKSLQNYVKEELGLEELENLKEDILLDSNNKPEANKTDLEESTSITPANTFSFEKMSSGVFKFKDNQRSNIIASLESLSISDITYGFIVLLLSLGLITYRKELHSYVLASDDYPKFYPPENGTAEIIITESEKQENQGPDTQTISVKTGVSDTLLAECEQLVDDLYDDLHNDDPNKSNINDRDWDVLEKICDSYIETHKEIKSDKSQTEALPNIQASAPVLYNSPVQKNSEEVSFEDMVTDLIDNLEDKSNFDQSNPTKKALA